MTVKLIHKTRSERGASLSMALLLMLVCTVVASVVITSASAAAGRLSQLKESDRSYYNVTSAASLIWDELGTEGKTVHVVRECNATPSGDSWVSPDSWGCNIDGLTSIKVPDASLFQVATADFLFSEARPPFERDRDYQDQAADVLPLTSIRSINETQISSTIDLASVTPEPIDSWNSSGIKYQFIMTATGCNPVKVTMQGEGADSFRLVFEEEENPQSAVCALVVVADPITPPVSTDGNHLEWNTAVTWKRDYITTEGQIWNIPLS